MSVELTRTGARPPPSEPSAPAVVAALHVEEAARMHGWSTAVMTLCLLALAFTPALPGTLVGKLAFIIALIVALVSALVVRRRCADPRTYTVRVFRVFGFIVATISFELVYFLGVFSPTPVVITLGITTFGLGLDRRFALIIPVYAIAGYVVLATLVVSGVVTDVGVIRASGLTLVGQLFGVVMVPGVLLLTLRLARLSRQTMETAARDCHAALRLANQREALLAEANQNLNEAGVRQRGPWTGQLAGAWKLAEIVGSGAMGDVYAASHVASGQPAAVKLLHETFTRNEHILERFAREGEITSALHLPNVVRVYEAGQIEGTVPYIAMELLEGEDLGRILRRTRVLAPDLLLDLVRQVACGLDAAHGAGIIHRDLKPQNLFQVMTSGERGTWKILDFGVSTLVGSRGTLTQAGLVGTPGYMAPEQARSQPVEPTCDVFSLGAVIYRAIVGRQPFGGKDTPQTLFNVVYRMPPRPADLVDALPRDVEAVIAIALAKRREDRFQTAGELASALTVAYRSSIRQELRSRAAALLRHHPWGESASAP